MQGFCKFLGYLKFIHQPYKKWSLLRIVPCTNYILGLTKWSFYQLLDFTYDFRVVFYRETSTEEPLYLSTAKRKFLSRLYPYNWSRLTITSCYLYLTYTYVIEWLSKSILKNFIKPHRVQYIIRQTYLLYNYTKNYVNLEFCLGQK